MIDFINFHIIYINFSEFRRLLDFSLGKGMGRVTAGVDILSSCLISVFPGIGQGSLLAKVYSNRMGVKKGLPELLICGSFPAPHPWRHGITSTALILP